MPHLIGAAIGDLETMRRLTSLALLALIGCGPGDPAPRNDTGMIPLVDAGVSLDTGSAADTGSTSNDAGTSQDTGTTPGDAGTPRDTGSTPRDAGPGVDVPDPQSAEDIATVRAAEPGPVDVAISQVMVTVVRPEIGRDAAGFFIQATQQGPALFVSHDPAPAGLQAGSIVSFRVTDCSDSYGQRIVTGISGLEVVGRGDHNTLMQDIADRDDLVSNLASYEAELLGGLLTIVGPMEFAGNSFVAATVDSQGLFGSDLRFRIPDRVQAELNLAPGCTLNFVGPMWRYRDTAQLSVFNADSVRDLACPGTVILDAVATRPTEVRLGFSRDLQANSLQANGSQFSINGLAIESASFSGGSTLVLVTEEQVSEAAYTVTVDETLLDASGEALDPEGRSIDFAGFTQGLRLRLTELSANVRSGCDLIELVALGAGSIEGYTLKERTTTILTFPAITVAAEDRILVHMNSTSNTCNASGAVTETQSKNEQANAQHNKNVDDAWDVWIEDRGLTATDNVFQVLGLEGFVQDAVLVSDAPTGTAASASERAAATVADSGEWTTQAGGVPEGGFIDDSFSAHAVQGLGDEEADGSTSLQRSEGQDNNHAGDWTGPAPASWGAVNAQNR